MSKRKTRSSGSSKTQEATHDENSSKMSLKLLVDKKGSRVLFAEAPKEFVDFLFHIFSLPLGTLIEFLGSKHMVGCLGKLKDSIESFNENYLQPDIKMDDIFNPKTVFSGDTLLLSYDASTKDQSIAGEAVYRCANVGIVKPYALKKGCKSHVTLTCISYVTLYQNAICPCCNGSMNVKMTMVIPKGVPAETKEVDINNNNNNKKKIGYVKEVVTYMVMDDLVVKPMSTISSITLINKFGVKDLSQLEERTVYFGKDQGLKLLMASLKTDKVLTKVFMH